MAKPPKNAISPTRDEDYPQWYQQVIRAADLAENSDVRGCMVIKPWGYAIWENMQAILDHAFKETGHKNAYFPLFIPKSYLEKEAQHVEGFAKECAVVTHHRLEDDGQGGLKPAGELDEPLVVRPTSEMIIGASFAKWVESYRDLPLLINQWANVVRWELRTRLFLRTTEFLWQEGHTAHATETQALEETQQMHEVYARFAEDVMAMPVIKGTKPSHERFPGALETHSIEAMMQDKKALQAGTSHFLGQNFAKAQGIQFVGEDEKQHHAWTTSWGVSTRLIGGLIMTHSDDDGLVLPPRLAPAHIVIMPITFKADDPQVIIDYCKQLTADLKAISYDGKPLRIELDTRDLRGGEKTWGWVKQGVPIRLEIGPRDMADDSVFMARRDQSPKNKTGVKREAFLETVVATLDDIQQTLFDRAKAFRQEHTQVIDDKKEFYKFFKGERGGFALTHWNGDIQTAQTIQDHLSVTIRCIPEPGAIDQLIGSPNQPGTCPFTNEPSPQRVVWSKAY